LFSGSLIKLKKLYHVILFSLSSWWYLIWSIYQYPSLSGWDYGD